MAKRAKITDAFCKTVPSPPKGNKLHLCGGTKGFALRVTAAGHRAFVFNYSAPGGRERRATIGDYGTWTVAAARARAEEMRREVDRGIDPLQLRIEQRQALDVGGLWRWYRETTFFSKLQESSQRNVKAAWEQKIIPLLGSSTIIDGLRRSDIQAFVDKIAKEVGVPSANRAHSFLRRAMALAEGEGLIKQNVASLGIERSAEHGRQRFLKGPEVGKLLTALEKHPKLLSAAAIELLLLTGARRSEVLGMRWTEVDLIGRQWTKPASRTKQKRVHHVPLSDGAISTLKSVQLISGDSEFVFPGPGRTGHLVEVKKTWVSVCSTAGIKNCRIHDLRHSFASIVASSGGSIELVGALLGHSQAQTTMRYAHFFNDALHKGAEAVSRFMKMSQATVKFGEQAT